MSDKTRHLHAVNSGWGTEGSEYRLDQFYVRAVDGNGHSSHQRLNIPPTLAGMVEEVLASGLIPEYRGKEDVYRDALVHRLEYLNKTYLKSDKIDRQLSVERRRALVDQLTLQMEDFRHLVSSIRTSITAAAMNQDWYALQLAIENAEIEAEAPTMREPYRSQILEAVNEALSKYGNELREG